MKVVLTGASGALGPTVLREIEQGHEITLLSRREVDSKHRQVIGDLTSLETARSALSGADAVIHLAAYSAPHPDAVRFNVLSTHALAEAARDTGIKRFVFASSNCAYGHCARLTTEPFQWAEFPVSERQPQAPEDVYGLSKVLGERLLEALHETARVSIAALRLNWVWRQEEILWRRSQTDFDLAGHASGLWAYVHELDCATAFRLALEADDGSEFGVYNISAADHMAIESTQELVDRFYPDVSLVRPLANRESLIDSGAARASFGYEPAYSWVDQPVAASVARL